MKNIISSSVNEKNNHKRVNFLKDIELSKISDKIEHFDKIETEDEDILKKFKEKKRRKNISKKTFNRDKAFSKEKLNGLKIMLLPIDP